MSLTFFRTLSSCHLRIFEPMCTSLNSFSFFFKHILPGHGNWWLQVCQGEVSVTDMDENTCQALIHRHVFYGCWVSAPSFLAILCTVICSMLKLFDVPYLACRARLLCQASHLHVCLVQDACQQPTELCAPLAIAQWRLIRVAELNRIMSI